MSEDKGTKIYQRLKYQGANRHIINTLQASAIIKLYEAARKLDLEDNKELKWAIESMERAFRLDHV